MNPGAQDPPIDVEMDHSHGGEQTPTSNPADKGTRDLDDEGRASKAVRRSTRRGAQ